MEKKTFLRFIRTTENAFQPSKTTQKAAGFDLHSAEDFIIPSKNKGLISTDLMIQLPKNTYGRIAPRSGLAWSKFIDIGGGVIDEDYTGIIKIIIYNHGDKEFKGCKGDRIAQLIVEKIQHPILQECFVKFEETERGEKGFGSSGGYDN